MTEEEIEELETVKLSHTAAQVDDQLNNSINTASPHYMVFEDSVTATIVGTRNDGTQEDVGGDVDMPVATTEKAGIVTAATMQQIAENDTDIDTLQTSVTELNEDITDLAQKIGDINSYIKKGRSIAGGNWQNKSTDSCYVIPINEGDVLVFKNSSNGYYGCLSSYSDDDTTANWSDGYWTGTGCSVASFTYTAKAKDKYMYVVLVLNGTARTPYEISINGVLLEDINKINTFEKRCDALETKDIELKEEIATNSESIESINQGIEGVWEGASSGSTGTSYEVNLKQGQVTFDITAISNCYADIVLYDDNDNAVANCYTVTGNPQYITSGNSISVVKHMTGDAAKLVVKAPAGSFNVKISTSASTITNNKQLINAVEQNIGKSGAKNIVYVKKTGSDGITTFHTVQSAINAITDASITNQYEIRVCDDFEVTSAGELYLVSSPTTLNTSTPTQPCAYIITKDYVNIVGYNRRHKISVKMPNSMAGSSQQYVQAMYLQGNCTIENLEFEIKNGRYAIHQESGGASTSLDYHAITTMKNCKAVHLGNSATDGANWGSICGQANGSCSGLKAIYENCIWKPMFYIHNNPNFDAPTNFKFKNCSIIPNIGLSGGFQGGYINTYGCGQNFAMDIEGCNFLGMDNNIDVASTNVVTDACHDIRTAIPTINGQGNIYSVVCRIIYSQYVLCFESSSNNVTISVTGGTAMSDIWGDEFLHYDGTSDAHGFIAGTEYIKDNAFTLGKRLGDCSTTNKTLILDVDGTTQTITFSENYTSMSNADIATKINSQLSNVVAKVTADKDNSMVMYPFKDCYEDGYNYTTSTILSGMPLIRDLGNSLGWKICPAGTKAEGMACERINPNGTGKVAILKKCLFKSFRDLALSGNYAKVYSNSGYWSAATDASDADLVQIATGIWKAV